MKIIVVICIELELKFASIMHFSFIRSLLNRSLVISGNRFIDGGETGVTGFNIASTRIFSIL